MSRQLILTRDVTPGECSWLHKTFAEGIMVYAYSGCTYGCIADGIACTEVPGETPFFELPRDSVKEI